MLLSFLTRVHVTYDSLGKHTAPLLNLTSLSNPHMCMSD